MKIVATLLIAAFLMGSATAGMLPSDASAQTAYSRVDVGPEPLPIPPQDVPHRDPTRPRPLEPWEVPR